ncbi:type II toxin-antitoxin system Phd/YefM family antitoxin [Alpinimonas psychrophila]|uniref:Antitoxin n=1 Tax=Alpinimonas psychrophila TaxID=748908 RepID=A0A7W3PNR8_9MICO|nr:type II toxin-antitoxin system Phd/YefM family antitoxin [Alpinimonas psychrophila]MBA8828690.1 prevent-host-death family protein [Alpinimonas psychrophila]
MTIIPATEARQKWAQTLELAHREPVTITQHGRASVVLLDAAVAKCALEALEDAQDIADAKAADAEMASGGIPISLDDIAKELGITLG